MTEQDWVELCESVLLRTGKAGWIDHFLRVDGKGLKIDWSPDGEREAENIQGLAKLNGVEIEKTIFPNPVPEILANTLIWKSTLRRVKKDGPPLTGIEAMFLFHILTQWYKPR